MAKLIKKNKKFTHAQGSKKATADEVETIEAEAIVLPRKGAWQREREMKKGVPGAPKTTQLKQNPLALTGEEILEIGKGRAAGKTIAQLAEEHGVADNNVERALKRLYTSSALGREILKGVLLENALAFGQKAMDGIEDLNTMQSVVATGIMTQRFIDLDKHNSTQGVDVDLKEVAAVGRRFKELDEALGEAVEEQSSGAINVTED